jgi:hypothetical protein
MNNLIYSNSRGLPPPNENEKNNFDFKKFKNNTLNSLNEVENFLNNFHQFTNYIKLYKILK